MRDKLIELLNTCGRCDKYGENGHGCVGCEYEHFDDNCEKHLTNLMVDDLIDNDVVIVVRCKDCKHWHRNCFDPLIELWEGECLHHKIEVMFENDFCSDGERRTN